MRFIKKRFSLWLIVLFIGVVAIAIPNAASVHVATKPQSDEEEYWSRRVERRLDRRQEYLDRQTGDDKDDAESKEAKIPKTPQTTKMTQTTLSTRTLRSGKTSMKSGASTGGSGSTTSGKKLVQGTNVCHLVPKAI